MIQNSKIGTLEVVTGSMYSGKSEELIRRLRRAEYAKQKIVAFKHAIDNRYGENGVFSHENNSFRAYPVSDVSQMEEIMEKNVDAEVIGIDEVQFFGEKVVDFCKKYVEYGKRVIVAGLDMSFRAEPYEPVPKLMSIADQVDKLHAICMVCGKSAYASQRLINGEPAYYDDPLVMVGASENYEARCRRHHIVRYRDDKKGKIYFIVGTEINVGKKFVEKMYEEQFVDDKKIKTIVVNGQMSGNEKTDLKNLREKINLALIENDYIFVRITGGLLLKLEGSYSILDFMCEFRKNSEVIIVSKNKKGVLNQILLTVDLLKKSDLNLKEIVYKNGNSHAGEEKEENGVIEKISKITEVKYREL